MRRRIELPVPDDGLKYPLGTPTDQETSGILLRCKAQSHKLKYDSQTIRFIDVVGDEGYRKTERYSEIVRFVPAPDGTNLIREGETKLGLLGSLRVGILISPRGACLKTLEPRLTGYAGLATSLWPREQVSFAADTTARFPEKPVRIGQAWVQTSREEAKHPAREPSLQDRFHFFGYSATLWQFLGVADVRGRRCAVLQGTGEGLSKTDSGDALPPEMNTRGTGGGLSGADIVGLNLIRQITSKRSTIVYFDYVEGIDVEYIASGPDVNTMLRPIGARDKDDPNKITISHRKEGESSDVMFVQISLVE
jgi:hypothetical protein